VFVEEATRLLASFVQFVQARNPELADQLQPLALEWAVREGIPLGALAAAVKQRAEQEASGNGVV